VHVVTVNDYLAEYQSELMGRIHRFLGLTTGCILTGQTPDERRKEYEADITYGTNNEFGFDYLRDNMAWQTSDCVQRGHNFVIVDEVDSILIDEARTPLIISGPADGDANKWYLEFARLAVNMRKETDYEVDEKKRTGGILEPAPSLLAFTNPSVNSFRRLVPGFEAPVNLVYSARNRPARIPPWGGWGG